MSATVATELAYTADDEDLRQAIRVVVERELTVAGVRRAIDSVAGWDESRWTLMTTLGWPGVAVPERDGGSGMGVAGLVILAEELGRVVDDTPLTWHATVACIVARVTDLERELLDGLASGATIATISIDPGALDPDALDPHTGLGSVVVETGGDTVGCRASGIRLLVPHGASADLVLLDVVVDGRRALALVETGSGGVSARSMTTLDITRPYAALELDGAPCRLLTTDADHLAWVRAVAIAVQSAESVGAARGLLEATVAYATQRQQFGQPIGSFQAIKHRLADMRIRLESSVAAMRYLVRCVDNGSDHAEAAAVAGCWVGVATSWLASEALQVFGGIGFTWEHDLHLTMRRLKANEALLGTPRAHRHALGVSVLRRASG